MTVSVYLMESMDGPQGALTPTIYAGDERRRVRRLHRRRSNAQVRRREMLPPSSPSPAPGSNGLHSYSSPAPASFAGHAARLRPLLSQLRRVLPDATAVKGLAADFEAAEAVLREYRERSKIFLLVHCRELCRGLRERAAGIAAWLVLLAGELQLVEYPDLKKKMADLAHDLQQSDFKATDNEERVYLTLQKEAESRQSSKAVQSAIFMDLARALGTSSGNHTELAEQIKLFKADLSGSSSTSDRRMLFSLEKIFETYSSTPNITGRSTSINFEEDAQIPPFVNFLCPLTKEVMKDPVVLESSQTYERLAIQHWFNRCIDDDREPTCPVTGQVLKSLEQRPNIGLAGAIEEWVNRNAEMQIKLALKCLAEDSSSPLNIVERVLDNIYNLLEEYPSRRYMVRNAGVVVLIVEILKNSSKSLGSHLRSKCLLVLLSMVEDDESKMLMIEQGSIRSAIHSLTGSSEKEKEYAVKLLLEFSKDEEHCKKIVSQKGSLVLLSSMAGDLENPTLSNLAEEVLNRMEKLEENVKHFAAAGRFRPLLVRLCEGNEDIRVEMASLVGNMTLPNNSKEIIARQGAKVFVDMVSKTECNLASIQALYNLSTLDDNASVLLESGALPALIKVLFYQGSDRQIDLKEFAAMTIANIVSKPGNWELVAADNEGHVLQSELMVHKLVKILPHLSSKCELAVLQILCGILSSPQASETAASHVKNAGGVGAILAYLEHPEMDHRLYAFRLTSLFSERLAKPLAMELKSSNKLLLVKETILDTGKRYGERSDAAQILANIRISSDEVKAHFETSFLTWTVCALTQKDVLPRSSRASASMIEGLLGILLHFAKSTDPEIRKSMQENSLLNVFRYYLTFPSPPRVKQKAALGLKYISESSRQLNAGKDLEPQLPRGFFTTCLVICGKVEAGSSFCPVHGFSCDQNSSFCLVKGDAVQPLLDLLSDENRDVQIAAVEALSTLLSNPNSLKLTVEELEKLNMTANITALFSEVRPGLLQERLVWMVERFLKVESCAQVLSADQSFVKALVEAFKYGNANTKRLAQEALSSVQQISGVGVRNSNAIILGK